MDILNNIWNVISTPNMDLVNILCVFLIFIEAPLTFYFISTIFKFTYTKKQKYIYITLSALITIINKFIIPNPFNIILNYLMNIFIIYFIFRLSFIKTFIASISPSIVFMLLENLYLNPYISILKISYIEAQTIPIYRIPFSFLMYLSVFILTTIFKYKNLVIDILDDIDKKNKVIIFLNLIFGFICLIFQVILTATYLDILSIQYSFFNFICLLIYFSISIYSLTRVSKLVATTQKLESAEEYNNTLHILHDSVRGFKHDFDNIVTTIGGYIKTEDIEGLKSYYSELVVDCTKVNNLYVLNPDIINNPGIYNLLTTKYNKAEEKGINVSITFLLDLNNLHMKIYDFAKVLGILLDNAIEAASECDEKELNIVFRNDCNNNRNIILIENTYLDKNIDTENIFNKGFTGKENHTGLGLWEVRQILSKSNNINLHTTKDEQYFSQQLEIYY